MKKSYRAGEHRQLRRLPALSISGVRAIPIFFFSAANPRKKSPAAKSENEANLNRILYVLGRMLSSPNIRRAPAKEIAWRALLLLELIIQWK